MPDINWCRDIDYGSLPQYIAIAVAAVAAYFSVRGFWLSQASFREDVRNREYAQARLVYGVVPKVVHIAAGSTNFLEVDTWEDVRFEFRVGSHQPRTWRKAGKLEIEAGAADTVALSLIVHNNSDELLGEVSVELYVRDGSKVSLGKPIGMGIIAPRTAKTRLVFSTEAFGPPVAARVTFRDSTGLWWQRMGSEPVTRIDG